MPVENTLYAGLATPPPEAKTEQGKPRISTLPANSKVICTLYTPNGGPYEKVYNLEGAPNSGTWEVEFTVGSAMNLYNCSIEAILYVGGNEDGRDTTSSLGIHPDMVNDISVIQQS